MNAPPTVLTVTVKPNAKQQAIVIEDDGSLSVRLKSSPMEGKANQELIELLARRFGVPKSHVSIKSGATARTKRVVVRN